MLEKLCFSTYFVACNQGLGLQLYKTKESIAGIYFRILPKFFYCRKLKWLLLDIWTFNIFLELICMSPVSPTDYKIDSPSQKFI